jgi:hypothetical protein
MLIIGIISVWLRQPATLVPSALGLAPGCPRKMPLTLRDPPLVALGDEVSANTTWPADAHAMWQVTLLAPALSLSANLRSIL